MGSLFADRLSASGPKPFGSRVILDRQDIIDPVS
jgi:hypothetical protein